MTNKLIQKERIVPFSLTESWSKWTTHEGLKTFFGRDNKIELEIGGNFEIYFLMDNPVGLRGSETCKILSFLPREMLSFSWNAPPHFESSPKFNLQNLGGGAVFTDCRKSDKN
jgi:uncharacterized protein YndB with AHSA1/START domain